MNSITVKELLAWQNQAVLKFTLLDVRRQAVYAANPDALPGARWLDPALWLDWKDQIPNDRPAVLACAHGHEISQGLTAALVAMGVDARTLRGGVAAWQAQSGQG